MNCFHRLPLSQDQNHKQVNYQRLNTHENRPFDADGGLFGHLEPQHGKKLQKAQKLEHRAAQPSTQHMGLLLGRHK